MSVKLTWLWNCRELTSCYRYSVVHGPSRFSIVLLHTQRRRSEEDEKMMRDYLLEGDLISVSFAIPSLISLKPMFPSKNGTLRVIHLITRTHGSIFLSGRVSLTQSFRQKFSRCIQTAHSCCILAVWNMARLVGGLSSFFTSTRSCILYQFPQGDTQVFVNVEP